MSLAYIIATVREVLGRGCQAGRVPGDVASLVAKRMNAMLRGIERLLSQMKAGTLVVRGARMAGPVEADRPARRSVPVVWPRRSLWLVRTEGSPAAGMGSQLGHLLQDPEMKALLLAAPQARRLLRPMCRMLGVATSLLDPALPLPTFSQPVERVVGTRVRAKRAPIDWGRIPLPRGVLSAARRAGFKPVR